MPSAPRSPASPSVPFESLKPISHTIRSERVILDADLARLYGAPTKAFNQAVKRNRTKLPPNVLL